MCWGLTPMVVHLVLGLEPQSNITRCISWWVKTRRKKWPITPIKHSQTELDCYNALQCFESLSTMRIHATSFRPRNPLKSYISSKTFHGFVQNASKLLLDVVRAADLWVRQRLVKIRGPHKPKLRKYRDVFRCFSSFLVVSISCTCLWFCKGHFACLVLLYCAFALGVDMRSFLASLAHSIFDSQATNWSAGDNSQCHSVPDWASRLVTIASATRWLRIWKNLGATPSQTISNTIWASYWIS